MKAVDAWLILEYLDTQRNSAFRKLFIACLAVWWRSATWQQEELFSKASGAVKELGNAAEGGFALLGHIIEETDGDGHVPRVERSNMLKTESARSDLQLQEIVRVWIKPKIWTDMVVWCCMLLWFAVVPCVSFIFLLFVHVRCRRRSFQHQKPEKSKSYHRSWGEHRIASPCFVLRLNRFRAFFVSWIWWAQECSNRQVAGCGRGVCRTPWPFRQSDHSSGGNAEARHGPLRRTMESITAGNIWNPGYTVMYCGVYMSLLFVDSCPGNWDRDGFVSHPWHPPRFQVGAGDKVHARNLDGGDRDPGWARRSTVQHVQHVQPATWKVWSKTKGTWIEDGKILEISQYDVPTSQDVWACSEDAVRECGSLWTRHGCFVFLHLAAACHAETNSWGHRDEGLRLCPVWWGQ